MERSDEARREDSLYDRLGSAQRKNRQQAKKIVELERIIEAKECVKIIQEEKDTLRVTNKYLERAVAFLTRENNGLKINNEKMQETFLKYNENASGTKEQIAAVQKEIDSLRTSHKDALEQIWNNLKLVKIPFC